MPRDDINCRDPVLASSTGVGAEVGSGAAAHQRLFDRQLAEEAPISAEAVSVAA